MKAITPYDEPGVSGRAIMGPHRPPKTQEAARHGKQDDIDPDESGEGSDESSDERSEKSETSEKEEAAQDASRDEPDRSNQKSPIQTISIIGQVEGHMVLPSQSKTTKYEHVIPQLLGLEQDADVKGVLVTLNTVGGDVEAGLAIAEMIASLSKPSVSLVLGGGHSIGVPIAVAASRSFIVPTATMTIHPIRISGYVIGVPQTFEYLDKMQDRVIQFVCDHSRVSERRLRELMFRTGELARDVGTILVGESAVKEGLIDEVGGLGPAIAALEHLVSIQEKHGGPDRTRRPRMSHHHTTQGQGKARGGIGPRSTPSFQRSKYGITPSPGASTP